MKKFYFLSLLICLGFSAFAQPVTVTIWASGAAGSFTTGNATAGARNDGNMVSTAATQRGYAVFNLGGVGGIPVGSVVSSVTIGMYTNTYGGSGVPSGWNTFGYAGDLSTVTVPATLFANMVAGTSLTTATYGTATGNQTLASTIPTENFIQSNAGGMVSICFTGGAARIYTFAGETGSTASTTTVGHAPYITVTYCPPPTALSAAASPNPVCDGDVLTLTGAATGASGGYTWSGPGGYSGAGATSTLTAAPTAAGVYTLTAINDCITYSATATFTTADVTVNPLPSPITGATNVCVASGTTLSDISGTGNWTSSDGSVATIGLSSGLVVGVGSGVATMSYTLPTGCFVTYGMTVNDPPTVIGGPTSVCEGASVTLTNGVAGGTWTSSSSGTAIVGASSGVVTGVLAGTVTITYTTGGCPPETYEMTVNPAPLPVAGPSNVCVGSTITLTDATPGGTWSSSSVTTAIVGSTGIVTGVSGGSVNIIYTEGGCQAVKVVVVNALPLAIGGPTNVCEAGTITVTDATPGGSFSGGAPFATITAGGVVSGITAGTATITYTVASTGCQITGPIDVDPLPAPISGSAIFCQNTTTTLSDPTGGGTWSSQNTTIATVGSLTGVVSGLTTPGCNITYTLGTGCYSIVALTINPAPASTITPQSATTFCAGGSVILDGSVGGVTYQWSNGGVPIAGETNASYEAFTSGSYTVDISNAFGCHTISAAEVVTAGIDAVIDFTTALHFCVGGNVVLTANPGGAVGTILYQWQKDGIDIPGATFVTYTATTSGVYTCVVQVSGGSGTCTVTTNPETVTVNSLPTPAITFSGTTLSTSNTYSTYQWYLNLSSIPGATNYSYVPHLNGSYRVIVGDAIGCRGFSTLALNIFNVGVNQLTKEDIKIYPNPANDNLQIEAPAGTRAVITGVEGRVVMEKVNPGTMDISKLAGGMYIITLYDENGGRLVVEKLIKE